MKTLMTWVGMLTFVVGAAVCIGVFVGVAGAVSVQVSRLLGVSM